LFFQVTQLPKWKHYESKLITHQSEPPYIDILYKRAIVRHIQFWNNGSKKTWRKRMRTLD